MPLDRRYAHSSQPRWGLLACIAVVIGGAGLLSIMMLYFLTGGNIPFDYAVVIDAGSTHSQMLLYQWAGNKHMGTADVTQDDTCSIDGGIANMKNPSDILPCIQQMVESIPQSARAHSYLYFGATAGMRLLNLTSPRVTELILLTLQCSLSTAGVAVKKVGIITGDEEGVSAWVTTNVLMKTLYPKEETSEPWRSTFGTLDMGGASTQYAFAINPQYSTHSVSPTNIRLYGHNYTLSADSYLCYGFTEARRRHQALLVKDMSGNDTIYDPCLPKGNTTSMRADQLVNQPCTWTPRFNKWLAEDPHNKDKVFTFEGGSDFEMCSSLIENQLNESMCKEAGFKECASPPSYFITAEKYAAVSSFFYITSFLNSTEATLEQLLGKVGNWCNKTWSEMAVLPLPPTNRKMVLTYCYGGIYITRWLTEMYGFNTSTWKNLLFEDKVEKKDLGWALGFMINASNAVPEEAPTPPSVSAATFSVLVIISVLVIFVSFILAWRFMSERRLLRDPAYRPLQDAVVSA